MLDLENSLHNGQVDRGLLFEVIVHLSNVFFRIRFISRDQKEYLDGFNVSKFVLLDQEQPPATEVLHLVRCKKAQMRPFLP